MFTKAVARVRSRLGGHIKGEGGVKPVGSKILFSLLLILLSAPVAARQDQVAYHFLRTEGKAFLLERIALNGRTVVSGTLIAFSLPLWVDKYLVDGQNELEVQYASDKTEPLAVVIEGRTRGPQKTEVLRFRSAPGETGGRKITKTVFFSVRVQRTSPVSLRGPDRQAIAGLLQTQYTLLMRRDTQGLRKLYERAMQEGNQIYPEGVEFFKNVLGQSDKMLANPHFRMKPFNRSGLQFAVDETIVLVSRLDHGPVMESEPVEVQDEVVFTQNGKEVRQQTKSQSKISSNSVAFRQFDGRWYLAIPFGP